MAAVFDILDESPAARRMRDVVRRYQTENEDNGVLTAAAPLAAEMQNEGNEVLTAAAGLVADLKGT
eukprot:572554-Prorocentrum_lima.AAC.1